MFLPRNLLLSKVVNTFQWKHVFSYCFSQLMRLSFFQTINYVNCNIIAINFVEMSRNTVVTITYENIFRLMSHRLKKYCFIACNFLIIFSHRYLCKLFKSLPWLAIRNPWPKVVKLLQH